MEPEVAQAAIEVPWKLIIFVSVAAAVGVGLAFLPILGAIKGDEERRKEVSSKGCGFIE